MANEKISALTAGSPAQMDDVFPIARSGANFSLTVADIAGLAGAPGGSTGNLQANNAGVFAGIPGTNSDFTNGTVTIAPPGFGASVAALTVYGDGISNDVQDWYYNGGSSPFASMDAFGELNFYAGSTSSTLSAEELTFFNASGSFEAGAGFVDIVGQSGSSILYNGLFLQTVNTTLYFQGGQAGQPTLNVRGTNDGVSPILIGFSNNNLGESVFTIDTSGQVTIAPNLQTPQSASGGAALTVVGDTLGDNIQSWYAPFYGSVTGVTIASGGSEYNVGDTGFYAMGGNNGLYVVSAVDGFGAVLSLTTVSGGSGYIVANNVNTINAGSHPGIGTGLVVNITSVSTGPTHFMDSNGNMTLGGNLVVSSRIMQAVGFNDIAGTISFTGTSGSYEFASFFNTAPVCTITPTSNPTSTGAYWVTTSTTSVTANVSISGTITFNFVCIGNPN